MRIEEVSLWIVPAFIVAGSSLSATANSNELFLSDREWDKNDQILLTQVEQVPNQNTTSEELPIEPCPLEPAPPVAKPEPIAIEVGTVTLKITDGTVFSAKEIEQAIAQSLQHQQLTLDEQIKKAAEAITLLYLNAGYLTSKATPVSLTPDDGEVEIRISEGNLSAIQIKGRGRLNLSYICSRVLLGVERPLNTTKLEEQLRLLSFDPLFETVQADLEKTDTTAQSQLTVTVTEADPFELNVSFDNYSPPSVGSERFGLVLGYRNLTGLGDEIFGSYYPTTTGGTHLLDFIYRVPLNPMNGTLQLRASPYWQEITQAPFDELGISGERELYEVSFRQPLVRTLSEEFALSVGFSYQDGQTFVFDLPTPFGVGPDEDGVSRTSVIQFGQDYISRDSGGVWAVRSQFNFGTGLFDATTNEPPIPDGHFFSWFGQVQRVQRLGDNHLLIIQADLQLTPDSLLPAQQFIIGGGQSVRGYRSNVRSGDNGFRFSIEDRIALVRDEAGNPLFQLAPFLDMGAVWNAPDNPNQLPDQTFLVGAGLGLLWEPLRGLSLRLDYGYPFIDLEDRGNNIQDDGFYFQLNYRL